MQKDNHSTPTSRRIRRLHHVSSPDLAVNKNAADSTINICTGMSRRRATLLPSNSAIAQNLTRKFAMDRTISLRQPLERDNESKDTELKLLYDEYLQKIMTEIILKKKLEEKEKLFLSRLATVAKECDSNLEKLFKLETRERDIIYLTKIQNDIDAQIIEVNKVTKNENIKMLKSISSQLYSLLQYVDVLRCNNVILPESSEEWNELHKTLKSCNETLKFIMDLIGTKSETYQSLNNDIKDFLNTYNNIQDHHKRLEKELGDLQALVLKTTSLSLM